MTPEVHREFSVTLLNRPGSLGAFDTSLGRGGISILGYLLQDEGDTSALRFVTDAPERTEEWLRAAGHTFRAADVLVVPGEARPGFVGSVAERLGAARVNILASYPASVAGRGCVVLAVDDVEAGRRALGAMPAQAAGR